MGGFGLAERYEQDRNGKGPDEHPGGGSAEGGLAGSRVARRRRPKCIRSLFSSSVYSPMQFPRKQDPDDSIGISNCRANECFFMFINTDIKS